uniref:Uncharacterized protein n=1 Tax=Candidatus Kentrum eta TaxID=2126337 RepID=A0A450UQY3_9GAMM|nr:MAG: hypothetical protein BECKH772A_GA0070896_100803 [Candidatus Kentron sp. H]VFJ95892.1 MAG: hypothetical protein BECKH772B_GA0070898_100844 [Candidatus Kentron sp. H]VFK01942.1 MAG: hypothetical protein BECKH772C_GA0070978_100773 [Candidatus Kentron sp. H]
MQDNAGLDTELFPGEYIPHILSSILRVGVALRKKSEHEHENPITIRLCKGLRGIERFRDGPFECHPQQAILSSDPDNDGIIGWMDISISGVGGGSEVYFAMEAKRLRYRSPNGEFKTGNSEYVGDKGMMRFITDKYAPHMETGAMLGYVFDGDIEKARSGIGALIWKKVEALRMAPPKKLVPSDILPEERIGETRHLTMNNRVFIIYHLFISLSEAGIRTLKTDKSSMRKMLFISQSFT